MRFILKTDYIIRLEYKCKTDNNLKQKNVNQFFDLHQTLVDLFYNM